MTSLSTVRLLIATPTHGDLTREFHSSLIRVMGGGWGIRYAPSQAFTSCDLVRARSRAVRLALDECCTHLLFWDDDVCGDAVSCLRGMFAANVDFIACPYPRKNLTGAMSHEPPLVAMGFTLLSERCLRKMWDAFYDDLYFEDVIAENRHKPVRTVAMFQLMRVELQHPWPHYTLLSEDYSFSERWLSLDEPIHLYEGPGSPLQHVGRFTFTSQRPTER